MSIQPATLPGLKITMRQNLLNVPPTYCYCTTM